MAFFATSGSVYGSDGVIAGTTKKFTQLFLVADAGKAASAQITTGVIAASVIALLRAPEAGMSGIITIMSSTCLSIDNLEDGDITALVQQ